MKKTITLRCKAFSTESLRKYSIKISEDGTVRVYDSVAGHYTTCHALSARTMARIRKMVA